MLRREMHKKLILVILLVFVAGGAANVGAKVIPFKGTNKEPAAKSEVGEQGDLAIARTRDQIRMLDDLYKTIVVLVTEHYVNDPSTLSAASAAKALFAAMKDKEWHDARLLGFTDVLFNAAENSPQDDFERTAQQKLLAGAPFYEEVIKKQGKRYLRVATPVPVVRHLEKIKLPALLVYGPVFCVAPRVT